MQVIRYIRKVNRHKFLLLECPNIHTNIINSGRIRGNKMT